MKALLYAHRSGWSRSPGAQIYHISVRDDLTDDGARYWTGGEVGLHPAPISAARKRSGSPLTNKMDVYCRGEIEVAGWMPFDQAGLRWVNIHGSVCLDCILALQP